MLNRKSVPKIITGLNDTINLFFKPAISMLIISNHNIFRVQWRNYNFCPPPRQHSLITVLIHNSGHFGTPLPFWAPGPPALPGLAMAILRHCPSVPNAVWWNCFARPVFYLKNIFSNIYILAPGHSQRLAVRERCSSVQNSIFHRQHISKKPLTNHHSIVHSSQSMYGLRRKMDAWSQILSQIGTWQS